MHITITYPDVSNSPINLLIRSDAVIAFNSFKIPWSLNNGLRPRESFLTQDQQEEKSSNFTYQCESSDLPLFFCSMIAYKKEKCIKTQHAKNLVYCWNPLLLWGKRRAIFRHFLVLASAQSHKALIWCVEKCLLIEKNWFKMWCSRTIQIFWMVC